MIFSVFQQNQVLGYSCSTLLWYWCFYPHRSRDALSPVCGIFYCILWLQGISLKGSLYRSIGQPNTMSLCLSACLVWSQYENVELLSQNIFNLLDISPVTADLQISNQSNQSNKNMNMHYIHVVVRLVVWDAGNNRVITSSSHSKQACCAGRRLQAQTLPDEASPVGQI